MPIDPNESTHDNILNNWEELCGILELSERELLVGTMFFFESKRQMLIAEELGETTVEVRRLVSNIYAKGRRHLQKPSSL